jgi:hypothetical protein
MEKLIIKTLTKQTQEGMIPWERKYFKNFDIYYHDKWEIEIANFPWRFCSVQFDGVLVDCFTIREHGETKIKKSLITDLAAAVEDYYNTKTKISNDKKREALLKTALESLKKFCKKG